MNFDRQQYLDDRQALIDAGAYDPKSERDACGVGLVAAIDGQPRREVVDLAIAALKAVWHRGAVDADGRSGDGAGLLIGLPREFFLRQVREQGREPRPGPLAVGMVFLPRHNLAAQEQARVVIEREVQAAGFYLYGWRQVPHRPEILGERAAATRPEIEQIMLAPPEGLDGEDLERALYLLRRRIEARALSRGIADVYVCSLSARVVIYKGMMLAQALAEFYPDLMDPEVVASVAVFHQRYSTNTFPEWRLAQPFRMLAHNGEINTLRGNANWMRSHEIRMTAAAFGADDDIVKPVIQKGGSDSAALDNVFEVLVRAGRSAPMAKTLLIPEASIPGVSSPAHQALYAYCNAVMEPWDGPTALCATDGRWVVAGKDRNGLRPLRVTETSDGLLICGSEVGMTGIAQERIARNLHIGPGRMIALDLDEGRLFDETAILDKLAAGHPYDRWLANIVDLEPKVGPGPEPRRLDNPALVRMQAAVGWTQEDVETLLDPMIADGKEAVGSMGDDAVPRVLSGLDRPFSHYFRQVFAQVTNPPIDSLREGAAMSLRTRFKNLGNILAQEEGQTRVHVLDSPVLTTGMFDRMLDVVGEGAVARLDTSFDPAAGGDRPGEALRQGIERLRDEAVAQVRAGSGILVLTDEAMGPDRPLIPMIMATAAVHTRLVDEGLRSFVSIVVRTAEALEAHAFAVLVGCGATAVNAWLAQETFLQRQDEGRYGPGSLREACLNYKSAIEAGLLKILAKKGISVISAYRGAFEFEALGLSRALVADIFPGMTSRVSGIGLAGLEARALRLTEAGFERDRPALRLGGSHRIRAGEERHGWDAEAIHRLQDATTRNDYGRYKAYSRRVREQPAGALRDLLDFRETGTVPLEAVESVNEIRKRFVTPGMSLGALSPEAHETLNIAMNRIGARSVSGEGGEDPERYKTRPNGDNPNSAVKQIASGRFGVTAEYLTQCREIEIKVAQGAKPGEGGQLPGFKVTEFIARMRHATPGVGLISPPPHHDIYSIEDLAQLIYDLKQINPNARATVKLVAQSGIGAVAAGVAKAKADTVLISGHNGGTGAAAISSIKQVGMPWEMGLSEAHQVLSMNGLRGRVRLRTDGGIRTGRDVVIAAMLGAEEFGIGTASLVAVGCLMVRQCHSNTCPVGVCVQDERLRALFTGTPDKVINLFTFIAEETREVLASLGLARLDDAVGRTDLLRQVSRGGADLDDLDLNPLLVRVGDADLRNGAELPRNPVPDSLDAQILIDAEPCLQRREKMQLSYSVRNTQRAIGTRTSSEIVRRHGQDLPDGHLTLKLKGAAGQSLAAWGMKGLRIELDGEANDYVGKGLSGAHLVIRPVTWRPGQALIGNTCLYGATSGRLLAAGVAGERFAVRNSGAVAVVEGCGAHGGEYMTGGTLVVLGPTGWNFGAGMSGGEAFVWNEGDQALANLNADSVIAGPVVGAAAERLKALIAEHAAETGSPLAQWILEDWNASRAAFLQVISREAEEAAQARRA
ncbi:glutamate synthase large subunit [Brevundimonas halotolerans]|uniref:Glutamate synthase (NADPH/NADH) large chain n=1 Tax=Brevundimonas halotolerans TaxID=69670 RepID=A0A7W9E842_9CAUL|nr:glutamate synthase large subunit [Brevundimonas halotolerans]MBB5661658.1 glutamate synthase (NADPH/NADH) large chain [Brevundimonas halotolerans]